MPSGNRTGPLGQGPFTGRGAGYCGGNATPGAVTAGRRGFGGRGRGRNRRSRRRGGGRMFQDTGPTGWQGAAAGEEALGEPAFQAEPPAAETQAEQAEQHPLDHSSV
jgi:hypothetical protein